PRPPRRGRAAGDPEAPPRRPRHPAPAHPMTGERTTFVMGIAGGTGSGKNTVAENVAAALPPASVVVLAHDWYYRDRSEIPLSERQRINYDHPDAMETELLVEHLQALRAGRPIDVPQYDFREHVRSQRRLTIAPTPIVLLEGILVLADERLRAQMDVKL